MSSLVSIITPAYNSEDFISSTIDSVLDQTYKNFELIIVDDCSNDNTKNIVSNYLKADNRIQYYRFDKNYGAAAARNLAIEKAKGKYIAFLDADDLWDQDKLTKQIKYMEENELNFTYTNYRYIDEEGNKTGKWKKSFKKLSLPKLLFFSSAIGCLTVIYNQEEIGKIKVPLLRKRNDVAIWHHVLQRTNKGYLFDETLASHRIVTGSLSRSTNRVKLLKHHYKLYRINMEYGVITSWILALSNAAT